MENGRVALPIWMFILILACFFFAGFNYGKVNALSSVIEEMTQNRQMFPGAGMQRGEGRQLPQGGEVRPPEGGPPQVRPPEGGPPQGGR
tara:strand:+ start:6983 stop:7249 length:267 start_codon:yes stop_codon:yes gene_type:complete